MFQWEFTHKNVNTIKLKIKQRRWPLFSYYAWDLTNCARKLQRSTVKIIMKLQWGIRSENNQARLNSKYMYQTTWKSVPVHKTAWFTQVNWFIKIYIIPLYIRIISLFWIRCNVVLTLGWPSLCFTVKVKNVDLNFHNLLTLIRPISGITTFLRKPTSAVPLESLSEIWLFKTRLLFTPIWQLNYLYTRANKLCDTFLISLCYKTNTILLREALQIYV